MHRRATAGGIALFALAALSIAMAAAGPDVVPAAARGDNPGWLRGPYGEGLGIAGGDYLTLERIALGLYLVVVVCASALPARVLWAGTIGAVAAFALAPPLLSLDLFSYASYARLEALHGLNPYANPPAAIPGDQAVAFVGDFRDAVSSYGPLFTLATTPLAHVGLPGFVWTLKAIGGLAVLGTARLAGSTAAVRGLDPRPAVALVALNPLVLAHVVGGAHNDALMALVMMAGVAAVVRGVDLGGGAGLVAAAGIKVSAVLTVPFALVEGIRHRPRLVAGIASGAVLLLAVSAVAFGSAGDQALSVATTNQELASRASLPSTVSDWLGADLDAVRVVALGLYGALLLALVLWTARGADWVRASGWAALGLLLATSYLTPWYAIWPLPLAAVARDRALVIGTILATAFLLRHQVPGLGG